MMRKKLPRTQPKRPPKMAQKKTPPLPWKELAPKITLAIARKVAKGKLVENRTYSFAQRLLAREFLNRLGKQGQERKVLEKVLTSNVSKLPGVWGVSPEEAAAWGVQYYKTRENAARALEGIKGIAGQALDEIKAGVIGNPKLKNLGYLHDTALNAGINLVINLRMTVNALRNKNEAIEILDSLNVERADALRALEHATLSAKEKAKQIARLKRAIARGKEAIYFLKEAK
jgi:5'-3' exonuclease